MAFDTLLDKVEIPRNQIHIMDTSLLPEEAAANNIENYFMNFLEQMFYPCKLLTLYYLVWETTDIRFLFSPVRP